jgi:imidazole glycerol-phosphate synthase subunit HisH
MIAVVDFGAGNTRSVLRALTAVGADARLVREPGELASAERLVLPGVGAAGTAMAVLQRAGMVEPLRAWAASGRPFLGVCLGAQLLLDESEENATPGLGILAGRCRAFPAPADGGPRIVPHIGWNSVALASGRRFDAYFVHGYWLDPGDRSVVAGTTRIDRFAFPSLLRRGALTGTQFHPEKSGAVGRALLAGFAAGMLDGVAQPLRA